MKASKGGPIFAAIDEGDASAVSGILAADRAVLSSRNGDGWTPLIAASYAGEAAIVQLAISYGADVSSVCKDKDSAVHYAAAQGHGDIIELLAAAGAPLDAEDDDGETPKDVAKGKKIASLIQRLIDAREAGADDKDGEDDEIEEEELDEEGGGAGGGAAASQ